MRSRLELVIVLVAAGYLAFILALVRRRQLREKYALLWLAVGIGAMSLAAARPLLDRISNALGIAYAPSTLFLFSTLFLMAVAAHLSWEVSRLEEKTRQLAEEIALLRAEVSVSEGSSAPTAPEIDVTERRPAPT